MECDLVTKFEILGKHYKCFVGVFFHSKTGFYGDCFLSIINHWHCSSLSVKPLEMMCLFLHHQTFKR